MSTNENAALTPAQQAAMQRLAEQMVDFMAAGIERFGSPERFMLALESYNAEKSAR